MGLVPHLIQASPYPPLNARAFEVGDLLDSVKLIKSIRASFMVNCLQAIPLAKINTSQKHTFLLSAIIPVLLLNADVWFMFIPKKIFVLIQAPFVASQF